MANCGVCGADVTFDIMQHYVPDFNGQKHRVCKNCAQSAQGKAMKYDPATNRIVIVDPSEIEVRKKCNICGKVFCYNPVDLDNNKKKQSQAVFSAIGSLGGAMSGHYAASAIHQSNANQATNGIVDYNKCPQCGSMDLRTISKEELASEMNYKPAQSQSAPQISVADELKKFKELLDMGAITQEEFDSKKNEILHSTAPEVQQPIAPVPSPQVYEPAQPVQAPVSTEPVKPNKIPNMVFRILLIIGFIRGFLDVFTTTNGFRTIYRGALVPIVGMEAYTSAIFAGVIWIISTLFTSFIISKIVASIMKAQK